jgi:hypothetical protein
MWIDPTQLRKLGIPVMEVDVSAGQGMCISGNVPHLVTNTQTPTIAWAWNILLPETLNRSYGRFQINRQHKINSKVTCNCSQFF